MKIFTLFLITALIAGCGGAQDNRKNLSSSQKANISERIKAFGVVNVSAEPENFTGPTSAYLIAGGAVQVAQAAAMPGESKYAACGACHGANGGGGVGPKLSGRSAEYIVGRLTQYKAGEKVGSQSNLMWGQAAMLSDTDMTDIAEYIQTM